MFWASVRSLSIWKRNELHGPERHPGPGCLFASKAGQNGVDAYAKIQPPNATLATDKETKEAKGSVRRFFVSVVAFCSKSDREVVLDQILMRVAGGSLWIRENWPLA